MKVAKLIFNFNSMLYKISRLTQLKIKLIKKQSANREVDLRQINIDK